MDAPIVVGFDGSPESVAAADWAAGEALRRRWRVELVQAWPWSGDHVLGSEEAMRWARQRLAEEAAELGDRLGGVEVTATHVQGDPVGVLWAAGRGAALLVLGSRAMGALRGFLTGSVSRQVLGRADCPVVLVRTDDGAPAGRDVVVGLSMRHTSDRPMEFACEAAAARSAPLRAVHAWSPPSGNDYLAFAAIGNPEKKLAKVEQQLVEDALDPWRSRYPQLAITAQALLGTAALTLLDAAAGADLLVIGRHGRRLPVGTQLGSVAQAAVHHAPCPVAVVPADQPRSPSNQRTTWGADRFAVPKWSTPGPWSTSSACTPCRARLAAQAVALPIGTSRSPAAA
ncbi:nucleotide-binding universal stress UspA family protein [Kitasatospora gansuensis]|uniref:Nucleotide-binding universal stress UspA family protein n=1 Tax=Kitasatospora gansuensis TaxID=258050 RepID=A0A7W7SKQ1_9ACTN|nr:nucleotide-binding universal stress UspA family protein [Kitasatospora gansuensis]